MQRHFGLSMPVALAWRRERGVEALSDPALEVPGRYLHLAAEDLRMREVRLVLSDYQVLLASNASLAEGEEPAAAAAAAAPAASQPAAP